MNSFLENVQFVIKALLSLLLTHMSPGPPWPAMETAQAVEIDWDPAKNAKLVGTGKSMVFLLFFFQGKFPKALKL